MPMISGRIKIHAAIMTKVLKKEMIAETLPLENAVNNEDEKIFNPANKKFNAKDKIHVQQVHM